MHEKAFMVKWKEEPLQGGKDEETNHRCLGSRFLGTLSQVLNDNGHEVRIWGNIPDQIDEINNQHTKQNYFKDILLDEKKAYHDLEETLKDVDAVFVLWSQTKVTRLVAQQVAKSLIKVVIMHASKGLNQIATNVYQLFLKRKSRRPS